MLPPAPAIIQTLPCTLTTSTWRRRPGGSPGVCAPAPRGAHTHDADTRQNRRSATGVTCGTRDPSRIRAVRSRRRRASLRPESPAASPARRRTDSPLEVVRHVVEVGPRDLFAGEALREDAVAAVRRRSTPNVAVVARLRRGDEIRRLDVRLGEVQRVVDDPGDRQHVLVARVVGDDRRLVARRRAVAADPAPLDVRGRGHQRRAAPLAGREAGPGVRRILRRVRTAVHPDRPVGAAERAAHACRPRRSGWRRAPTRCAGAPAPSTEYVRGMAHADVLAARRAARRRRRARAPALRR